MKFFRFNRDGSFAGTDRITRNIELSDDGKEFAATAFVEIFDIDEKVDSDRLCNRNSHTFLGAGCDSWGPDQTKFERRKTTMKRIVLSIALLGGMYFTAAIISSAQHGQQQPEDSTGLPSKEWKRGLAISPVPLNLNGRDKQLVGLGSYIVNAQSACSDCHTNPPYLPGGDPFFGQQTQANVQHFLAGGVQFGPFTSRNITPEPPSNLPAGLTLDQFMTVLRTGKDFDNLHPQFGPLLQVMPWPVYGNMTDDDLRAIYEYLSAIPHAEPAP